MRSVRRGWPWGLGCAAVALAVVACARGGAAGFDRAASEEDVPVFGSGDCVGGSCPQSTCRTMLSGSALAPNGFDPLGGVIVYVPTEPLEPLAEGARCERCDVVSGAPMASAVTTADGHFTLEVPPGAPLDLVVQLGKWRRKVTLPPPVPCTNNRIAPELTRLPRTHFEGDIPRYAVSTGNCDRLECVLRKIGIADSEFTTPSGHGRVHLFRQNGASLPGIPSADVLTSSLRALQSYDVVLFDCAGEQDEKSAPQKANVIDYTSAGGRVFASHFSYVWLYDVEPFSKTAEWHTGSVASSPVDLLPAQLDTSHPRGAAFAQWMAAVGAVSSEDDRTIYVIDPRFDVGRVFPPAERWIYTETPATVQEFTFDTPIGAPPSEQCGRVAFADFHVTGLACTPDGLVFPQECDAPSSTMTPQERIMEYMLFDLASCPQGYAKPRPILR